MEKLKIVTTSWDDGNPKDFKIATLLRAKGLGGTFYVPFGHENHHVLNESDLRSLKREGFEIGGHGLSHLALPGLSTQEIDREVRGCKERLEDILGEPLHSFCYPRGRFSSEVQRCLSIAGYRSARTTRMLAITTDFDPFQMPTSLQVYPHPRSTYVKNLVKAHNIRGLCNYSLHFSRLGGWLELGRRLFDLVVRDGGIWHLYGHSWEIEELDLWVELQQMLDYVSNRPGISYLSNGAVSKLLAHDTISPQNKQPSSK